MLIANSLTRVGQLQDIHSKKEQKKRQIMQFKMSKTEAHEHKMESLQ